MVTNKQFIKTNFLTSCKVCGGRTQCQHYLLHIGVGLKLALQGGASQTSYKSPWDLESADSDTEGAGVGRSSLHFSQTPSEAYSIGLGTMLCRARLKEPSEWTALIL